MSNKKLAIDWLETVLISEPYSEEDFEHNERCWEQAKVMEEDGKHESYLYGHKVGFTKAKEMEKEQQNINEEKLRESLLTINLINPVHLKMVSDGRGEFPDSYNLTQKGIDDLVETIKSR